MGKPPITIEQEYVWASQPALTFSLTVNYDRITSQLIKHLTKRSVELTIIFNPSEKHIHTHKTHQHAHTRHTRTHTNASILPCTCMTERETMLPVYSKFPRPPTDELSRKTNSCNRDGVASSKFRRANFRSCLQSVQHNHQTATCSTTTTFNFVLIR